MSVYTFAPTPDLTTKETPFAFWEGGFTNDQIDTIVKIGEKMSLNDGVAGGKNNQKVRKSKVSWLEHNQETNFIYDQLAYITRQLNGQFFEYDLFGFVEHMQYTRYEGDGGHYDWHIDRGAGGGMCPRKLSVVMQLSDPNEYEGGDLEFLVGGEPLQAKKQKGIVYAFPSFVLHRVTPVTKGTRKSLVVWVAGPKFK